MSRQNRKGGLVSRPSVVRKIAQALARVSDAAILPNTALGIAVLAAMQALRSAEARRGRTR